MAIDQEKLGRWTVEVKAEARAIEILESIESGLSVAQCAKERGLSEGRIRQLMKAGQRIRKHRGGAWYRDFPLSIGQLLDGAGYTSKEQLLVDLKNYTLIPGGPDTPASVPGLGRESLRMLYEWAGLSLDVAIACTDKAHRLQKSAQQAVEALQQLADALTECGRVEAAKKVESMGVTVSMLGAESGQE